MATEQSRRRANRSRRRRREAAPRGRARSGYDHPAGPWALAAVGLLLVLLGGWNLAFDSGATGTPVESVAVEECHSHRSGRSSVTDCAARADGAPRVVRDVYEAWPAGTVVPVRCTAADACSETGARPVVEDGLALAGGVGLIGGGVYLGRRLRR
ncbi:hypothetical protein ACGFX4_31155 [Kitasatospora sp. NPDC048365]|uniref:hypothetical protein n=1 Tax=Kitasatospora sp. NPDC048365 TaxID=3364050 RepID=UPI003717B2E9